ncbi:PASTA domain-containing protein [Allorhizocola rhizosphaerae]|uniref:PASTA domain-containing protein n=1 Tax=Allorhizocola rhizosphaerae TaxID=1872709 RepID=UPI0013C362B3|nr:hypothetical protein [Allorhizocola rhizosphaerae]
MSSPESPEQQRANSEAPKARLSDHLLAGAGVVVVLLLVVGSLVLWSSYSRGGEDGATPTPSPTPSSSPSVSSPAPRASSPAPTKTSQVPTIRVPEVATVPREKAESILKQAGFTNIVFEELPESADRYLAVRTQPAAGQRAARDARIVVYFPNSTNKAVMPDLVGKEETAARTILASVGLKSQIRYDCPNTPPYAVGTVWSQQHPQYALLQSATTVQVCVVPNT